MTSKVLDAMIQDLLDGCIDPGGLRYLEHELVSNPQALSRYLAFADLHGLLDLQSSMDDQLKLPDVRRVEEAPVTRRRFPVVSILSIAAVLIFVGVAVKLIFVGKDPAFRVSNHSTYTLTDNDGETIRGRNLLKEGSRLELQQGSMEINFDSGVRGVIVAPADLTFRDKSHIDLKKGNAWFHVPAAAAGFQVNTGRMEVVDLGTEFGIRTDPDGDEEIHVLKGKVRAGAFSGNRSVEILEAGEARRLDAAGNLVSIPVGSGDFIQSLPDKLPHLHWSFDEISGDRLPVSGTFPSSEKIHTTLRKTDFAPGLVPGKSGMALSLNGQGDHAIADWAGFAGNRPRTVSFWVRLPAPKDSYYKIYSGIVGWGNESDLTLNSKWKILAVQDARNGPAFLRLSWGAVWLNGTSNLADGRWHHIAVATTGNTGKTGLPEAELYVDGARESASYGGHVDLSASPAMDTDTISRKSMPLALGCDLNPDAEHRIYFQGEIDELTIFDGYLPESEIRGLSGP